MEELDNEINDKDLTDSEKAKLTLNQKFKAKRSEITRDIQLSIDKLSNLKTLKDAQVNMLSLRQRLLEDNHTLLEHLSKLRKRFREEKAKQMESLSTNMQMRYQSTEKNTIIEGRTSTTKEMLELFENQIQYFTESIKTVDNVIFGIKTRLDIEKTLGL